MCDFRGWALKLIVASRGLSGSHGSQGGQRHVVRSLKQRQRGSHTEDLRPPAASHAGTLACEWVLQPQLDLQMTAALADMQTATSGGTLHQTPQEPLLSDQLTERTRGCLLFSVTTVLGNCYAGVDN